MPNLLPTDVFWWHFSWMPDAGRLVWSGLIVLGILGLASLLLFKPRFKNRFSTSTWVLFGVGVVVLDYVITLVLNLTLGAALSDDNQTITIALTWVGIIALYAMVAFAMASRKERKGSVTWAEAIAGAVAFFGISLLSFGTLPNEWLLFGGSYLNWTSDSVLFQGVPFPDYFQWEPSMLPSIRAVVAGMPFTVTWEMVLDVVVCLIYGAVITAAISFFVMWQKRPIPFPGRSGSTRSEDSAAGEVIGKSKFGRPLRLGSSKA